MYHYGRIDRVLDVQTLLPANAPSEYQNPAKLFNAIENYETASNARTAKKIMVALPREFDRKTQKEVLENFIKENITAQGYACTYAIHIDPENKNPHAHILIANRQISHKGEWSTKSRKEYALNEQGKRIPLLDENGEQKLGKRNEKLWKRVSVQVNPLDTKEMLEKLREQWAIECNKYLGNEQKIDHRSFYVQGAISKPTIHEGYVSRKIEKKHEISERCEYNRQIKQINNSIKEIQEEINKAEAERQEVAASELENKQKQQVFENGKSERECTESRYSERTFGERNFKDGKRIDCSIARDVSKNAVRELRAGSRKLDTGQRPGNLPNLLQGATHDSGRPTDEVQRNGETAVERGELPGKENIARKTQKIINNQEINTENNNNNKQNKREEIRKSLYDYKGIVRISQIKEWYTKEYRRHSSSSNDMEKTIKYEYKNKTIKEHEEYVIDLYIQLEQQKKQQEERKNSGIITKMFNMLLKGQNEAEQQKIIENMEKQAEEEKYKLYEHIALRKIYNERVETEKQIAIKMKKRAEAYERLNQKEQQLERKENQRSGWER